MEHRPPFTSVTVLPATVQIVVVVEAKLTGSPDVAVAETVNGGVLTGTLGSAANVMVCDCCTGRVEKYHAPRPCVARASSCKLEFSSRCTPCAWGSPPPTAVQVVYGLGEE